MNIKIEDKKEIIEFSSLNEFYKYICDTPFNETFRWDDHSSVTGRESFTKTKNFEEAVDLFKNGWTDMAKTLTQKMNASNIDVKSNMIAKNILDVCGYQAIVPLYLQGVPNSMVNKKMTPVKQKVITINKSIAYSASVSAETIIEESIKAMQIIKKIEAQGIRCNLNIVLASKTSSLNIFVKIRVKNATEKLNISKLAFPLVHPSMLRRLFFRFVEVHPTVTKDFTYGYGMPSTTEDWKKILEGTKEYYIPNIINKDIAQITCLDDIC